MERQLTLFKWVRTEPQDAKDWEAILIEEQFNGPSANLPIAYLCDEAWKQRLFSGSNTFFIKEVAAILPHVQPLAPQPKSLTELNLEQIAGEIGAPITRVAIISNLMAKFKFITI